MNSDFYNKIAKSNASTNCRNNLKKLVLDEANLLVDLTQIATTITDKNHYKAVWIIEMIAETHVELLTDFTSDLIDTFSKCKHQSAPHLTAARGSSRPSTGCAWKHPRRMHTPGKESTAASIMPAFRQPRPAQQQSLESSLLPAWQV